MASISGSSSAPCLRNPGLLSTPIVRHGKRSIEVSCAREGRDWGDGSQSVDEGMITLRKRIQEVKTKDRSYELPENWMGWEKKYRACYDECVCKLIGVLQIQLMNTRPSLALGILVLIAISLPVSTALILYRLIDMAVGI